MLLHLNELLFVLRFLSLIPLPLPLELFEVLLLLLHNVKNRSHLAPRALNRQELSAVWGKQEYLHELSHSAKRQTLGLLKGLARTAACRLTGERGATGTGYFMLGDKPSRCVTVACYMKKNISSSTFAECTREFTTRGDSVGQSKATEDFKVLLSSCHKNHTQENHMQLNQISKC